MGMFLPGAAAGGHAVNPEHIKGHRASLHMQGARSSLLSILSLGPVLLPEFVPLAIQKGLRYVTWLPSANTEKYRCP